MRFYLTLLIS